VPVIRTRFILNLHWLFDGALNRAAQLTGLSRVGAKDGGEGFERRGAAVSLS
jgi:hypothetical protein